jgi:peroxiredoxin Q/BCP
MEGLRQHAADLDRAGYNVIALSRDTGGSHARYAAAKGISFVLASDSEDRFAHAVDAMIPKKMYGRSYVGPARAAFVIDRDGTILAVLEKIDAQNHGAELKALIKTLSPRKR